MSLRAKLLEVWTVRRRERRNRQQREVYRPTFGLCSLTKTCCVCIKDSLEQQKTTWCGPVRRFLFWTKAFLCLQQWMWSPWGSYSLWRSSFSFADSLFVHLCNLWVVPGVVLSARLQLDFHLGSQHCGYHIITPRQANLPSNRKEKDPRNDDKDTENLPGDIVGPCRFSGGRASEKHTRSVGSEREIDARYAQEGLK